MTRNLSALAIAAVLSFSACASSLRQADSAFDGGDYARAAAAYEARLAGGAGGAETDRLLFRLGIAYALASSPVHDPARAHERFAALVARYPRSPYCGAAALVIELQDAAASCGERAACLQDAVDDMQAQADRRDDAARAAQASLHQKDEELVRLHAALAEAQAQLQRVLHEIEQLKRIDLQRTR